MDPMGYPPKDTKHPPKTNSFKTPKTSSHQVPCLGWQTHTLPSRLHHDLTKGLIGRLGAVGSSRILRGAPKKDNKWKTRVDLNKQHQFT